MNTVLSNIIDFHTSNGAAKWAFDKRPKFWNVVRRTISEIVEAYLLSPEIESKLRTKYFGEGYRRGYMDRSDEIYEIEMVDRYSEYFGNPKSGIMAEYIADLSIDIKEIAECEKELLQIKLD